MNEFLIKGETLKATADAIRHCIHSDTNGYTFIPSVDGGDGKVVENSVIVYYREIFDDAQNGGIDYTSSDTVVAYDFLENNEGQVVPVLYDTLLESYPDEPDIYEPFFYEGTKDIDGVTYDKWRKIELGDSDNGYTNSGEYRWDTEAKQYIYTNVIVANNEISPVDFPQKIQQVYESGKAAAIGNEAFKLVIDRSITDIDLTGFDDITTIGAYTFCQCTNLTRVILPYVETIGEYAFYNCPNLKTVLYKTTPREWDERITIGEGNEQLIDNVYFYCENREDFIDGCWYWHYVDGIPTVWEGQVSRGLEYTLLDDGTYSVTGIGTCTDTYLILPRVCNGIAVTTIGASAFYGCKNITDVVMSNSITTIKNNAFNGCANLANITFGDSVTTIEDIAFYNCQSLTNVVIPNGVTTIGGAAFGCCTNLATITIPHSVTIIGRGAFEECTNFNTVYYDGTCYYGTSGDWSNIAIGENNEELNNANIVYSTFISDEYYVYTINNDWTAYGCMGVSESYSQSDSDTIVIPNMVNGFPVTWIGDNAFENHSEYYVTIGDNVAYIGDSAFYGCTNLQDVTIPVSVTTIGYDAFYDFVHNGGTFAYEGSAIQWNAIDINDEETRYADVVFLSPLPTYTAENGITYEGSSDNSYYVCTSAARVSQPNVTIADYISGIPVKEIGAKAFGYGTPAHSVVETITIPNTVEVIGEGAFALGTPDDGMGDPTYVTSTLYLVDIPNSVTTIGDYAFYYCTSLSSIAIPDSVISIGERAFENCIRLSSIDLGNGVQIIKNYAFMGVNMMAHELDGFSIAIPDSVTTIGSYVFSYSTITEVTFGENSRLDTISDCTFEYCSRLYYIALPMNLISIGDYAFYDCNSLTDIIIPSCVASIGSAAFSGTSATIYVPWSEGQVANAPWGTNGEVYYDYS